MGATRRTTTTAMAAALLAVTTACSLLPESMLPEEDPCLSFQSSPAIYRNTHGYTEVNSCALRPVYKGRYITEDERRDLSRRGLAQNGFESPETACQGVYLLFDTDEEVEHHMEGFESRHPKYWQPPSSHPAVTSDPCDEYADAPRFVTEE